MNGPSTVSLLGQTIGENLAATVAQHGAREALVDVPSGRRWTYDEFAADVEALAKGLLALGIAKGERVGIWAPNCAEWVLVQYATARVGAILVNINPAYRSHELSYALSRPASARWSRPSHLRHRTTAPWSTRWPATARSYGK